MMIQQGQRIMFHHPTTFAQRTGGGVTVSTVLSKDNSTDIVTFDAVRAMLSRMTSPLSRTRSTVRHRDSITSSVTREQRGSWTPRPVRPSTVLPNPFANANVIDKSAAALAPDFLDTIALQTSNQEGDGKPRWDAVMVSHAAQQNMYRKLGYALTRTVNATGNNRLDLGFAESRTTGWSGERVRTVRQTASRSYALQRMENAGGKSPRMYDFQNGPLIQKPGTDRYYDAAQFAVYARYALVCKEPYSQWLIKNLSFTVADVRRTLN